MPRAPKPCARCTRPVRGRTYCDACQPIGWRGSPSANNRTHTREERGNLTGRTTRTRRADRQRGRERVAAHRARKKAARATPEPPDM